MIYLRPSSRLQRLLLLFALAWTPPAQAEADTFGTGDGHSGALTAAQADLVVNTYAPLTANASAGASTLAFGTPIGAATPFAANDLVMIWRATGVAEAEASGQTPVNVHTVASGEVGRYELARVQSAAAGTLTLVKPLVRAWEARLTQVVRVPEYTTVSVPAGTSLAAQAWTGDTTTGFAGGILVFLANGTVTNDGRIHADARGFRGGADIDRNSLLALSCPNGSGTAEEGYAPKGEGLVATRFGGTANGGRDNRAHGGGGGNCIESGGAGGGNAGSGGRGGESFVGGAQGTDRAGLGGAKLTYTLASETTSDVRITVGGGGGSGEQKDDRGSGGGTGGGAVFVRAKAIAGTGVIGANGKSADNVTTLSLLGDGAGGGGAGGTVLLRIVDNLDCNGIEAKGGRGGSTEPAGTNLFGPGGGGGGGRILVQTKARGATCTFDASAGIAGTAGDGTSRQATAGGLGEAGDDTAPRTDPNYCFSNAGVLQCTNPRPVCNEQTGYCTRCNGGNGDPTDFACPDPARPVCATTNGTCESCNGDLGSGTSTACQLSSAPYCFGSAQANPGSCGRCTSDPDCAVGTHPGPKCETVSGTCGRACVGDGDCKATEWCAQNVCIPKTANRQPVTSVPPFAGECTREAGQRTCVAGVCEESDDRCGFKNGTPCTGSPQCRSDVCFDRDDLCGKPTGEPCARSSECRSDACENGACAGCQEDSDCTLRQVCDTSVPNGRCVPGCRPGSASRCAEGESCVARDAGIGTCEPSAPDGGTIADTSGIVEGGGCSCETTPTASPFAIAGISFAVLALVRRRRDRKGGER